MRLLHKSGKSIFMSRLFARSGGKFSSATVVAPIDPGGLANLAARYIMNTGITSSGGFVSQWNDQSGNGRHLAQADAAKQPALQGDGSLIFDGSNDFMQALFAISTPATVYGVIKLITRIANANVWTGGTYYMQLFKDSTATTYLYQGSSVLTDSTGYFDINKGFRALGAVYNGASSIFKVNTYTSTTGSTSPNGARGGFTLGSDYAGSTAHVANIHVKEIIIFTGAHAEATVAGVNAYLMNTYGIT